jgi:hypothetical protein
VSGRINQWILGVGVVVAAACDSVTRPGDRLPDSSTSTARNPMLSPEPPGTVAIGEVHEPPDRSHL